MNSSQFCDVSLSRMVVEPNCDVDNVTDLLRTAIPEVEHTRTHGKEISYTVPLQEVSKFSGWSVIITQMCRFSDLLSLYGSSIWTLVPSERTVAMLFLASGSEGKNSRNVFSGTQGKNSVAVLFLAFPEM